jgi:hypothetical protein
MSYQEKKVRHVQEIRRSGASGFHSKRGYDRNKDRKELINFRKGGKVKKYE